MTIKQSQLLDHHLGGSRLKMQKKKKQIAPYHIKTIYMNHHFCALEFVEFFTNGGLFLRSQPRPRPVGSPVVVLSVCHFDIVVEAYDLREKHRAESDRLEIVTRNPPTITEASRYLSGFELFDCRPETELAEQSHLLLLALLLLLRRTGSFQNVALLQFLLRRPQTQAPANDNAIDYNQIWLRK